MKIFTERGYSFIAAAERGDCLACHRETVLHRKRSRRRAQIDCGHRQGEKTCELPDGNIITVGAERFHCAEWLFQPSFTGKEASGFHDTSFQYVMKCDVYIRKELYANVVLSGGTAIFQGIVEYMTKELTALAPSTVEIKVVAPTRYGLEDLSCLPSDLSRCGPRRASTESGPSIVHGMCL